MFVTSRHASPNDRFIIVTCRLPVIQVAILVILLVLLRILLDFSIPFSSFGTEPNQQLDRLCDEDPPTPPHLCPFRRIKAHSMGL